MEQYDVVTTPDGNAGTGSQCTPMESAPPGYALTTCGDRPWIGAGIMRNR
jgi:hypothetical protein